MDIETTELETKAGIPAEAVVTHAEMMRAFEELKQANDQRLAEKRPVDVVLEEKIARLDSTIGSQAQRLEAIELKQARPVLGSEKPETPEANKPALEHKAAFDAYVRSGDSANLRALEQKALSAGSNPDGGFVVPPEIETQIGQRLFAISPIRALAGLRTISGNVYKKPFMTAGAAVWLGRRDRSAHADRYADARRTVVPGDGALRHAGGDRDAARRFARSISTSGWRRRWSRCSPSRRALPSSPATASTSRRASSPTRRWPTRRGPGAISATSRPASPAPFRRPTRPTC